jgi:N-carbamoylputrescine amidase
MTSFGTMAIRLAAIQASALPGQIAANLTHAEGLIEQAAGQGATVVVLPELFSCGYVPNRGVWDAAEARGTVTDRWLAATARRLGIYLGAGAAETDGTDFFIVFTLAAPTVRSPGAPARPTPRPASSGAASPRI